MKANVPSNIKKLPKKEEFEEALELIKGIDKDTIEKLKMLSDISRPAALDTPDVETEVEKAVNEVPPLNGLTSEQTIQVYAQVYKEFEEDTKLAGILMAKAGLE